MASTIAEEEEQMTNAVASTDVRDLPAAVNTSCGDGDNEPAGDSVEGDKKMNDKENGGKKEKDDDGDSSACGKQVPSAAVSTAVDAAEKKLEGRRRKMKEIMMPQCEVDYVLSYEVETCDPKTEAWLKAFDPELYAMGERDDRRMLAEQEDFKRQIALKGYVSRMVQVADDDEEEDDDDDEGEYDDEEDEGEDYALDYETLEEPRN